MLDLVAGMDDQEWTVQSLCPAWDVRGVASHVIGIEHVLSGWTPGEVPAPFAKIGEFVEATKALSGADFVAHARSTLAAREAELAGLGDDVFNARSWTPVGMQTYGRFMAVRVFDFWVHEQDIRVPMGKPGHLSGPAAEMALEEVRGSFGYIAGKRAGVPDGKSVTIHVTGPVSATLSAVVDGKAKVVAELDNPTCEVTTDFLTFMLLCCGRIDPQGPIGEGKVTYAGDVALADQVARNLRFTI